MFSSGVRARLSFALAGVLAAFFLTDVARADEVDDASSAIMAHINSRAPSPVPQQDQARIASFLHYLVKTLYYPPSLRELQASAMAAADAVGPSQDSSALVQAAIAGIVDSIGHGARLLTTIGGGDAPADGSFASRQLGSLWVVPLPTMSVINSNSNGMHTCADLAQYVGQPPEGVTGVVLDLRGNEGGPLTDSSCLASLFLKKGQPLFQVISKQGKLVNYESEPAGHNVLDLPVAVLIDGHTDNGGLLVAAVLQDHHRATVIGEQKASINGAVSALVFPPGVNRGVILPTGEILLADKRPLSAGIRVDVAMSARDDGALMSVAQRYVARR